MILDPGKDTPACSSLDSHSNEGKLEDSFVQRDILTRLQDFWPVQLLSTAFGRQALQLCNAR